MGGENLDRYRLVILGSSKCGKTSIIRRYLHHTFSPKYRETVEDIYAKDFRANGNILPLNFYDTNFNYPDMRRVSISAANAFLLVFAVDDVNSFKEVTKIVVIRNV
uniref:Uncharacterized protein n=1 Tax=Romanomermis culicivorax TaxID=13658 RepID=A0A915IMA1_ROMCU